MAIEKTPNLKQQVSREMAWHLADAAQGFGIEVHVIAQPGENVTVSHDKSFKVNDGNVGIDMRKGAFDTQILNDVHNKAISLQNASHK